MKITRYFSDLYKVPRNPSFKSLTEKDLKYFESILPSSCIVKENLESYNEDWLSLVKGNSSLLLRPKTTQQVSTIMQYCNQETLAVVPQAGNTSQVAGGVPVHDEIILSTNNMNSIFKFDENIGVVWCDSGVVLETLNNYCMEKGFIVPLDLGAKGSCHIGGNLATNAAGLRYIRYGSLHGNVLGLEAVLADGEVVSDLKALRKDNTGYDLKQLFIGSEGTLGVITKLALLLAEKPTSQYVACLGCESYEKVLQVLSLAKKELGEVISAFEFLDKPIYDLILKNVTSTRDLLSTHHSFYVIVETSGTNSEHDLEKFESFLEKVTLTGMAQDGILAQDEKQAQEIWKVREGTALSTKMEGHVFKYDVSLPLQEMYRVVERVRKRLTEEFCAGYGHVGDGNLHLAVATKNPEKTAKALEPFVYEEVQRLQGSVSAEHGVGLTKPSKLKYSKTPQALQLMKQLKTLFDPKGILNPYKVLI